MTLRTKQIQWDVLNPFGEMIHVVNVKMNPGQVRDFHDHDFYECFLVESGRGVNRMAGLISEASGDGDIPLRPGELHFLRPQDAHGIRPAGSQPLVFTNVALSGAMIELTLSCIEHLGELWSRAPCSQRLTDQQVGRFNALVQDVSAGPRRKADALYFLSALERLLRPSASLHQKESMPQWMCDALPRAAEPENLQAGLARLIALCGRSPEHVGRSFRRFLGVTPTQWLNTERVRYACRLLETSQRSILDIALECGFSGPGRFHQCFRQQTGFSPLRYRKRAAGVQMCGIR